MQTQYLVISCDGPECKTKVQFEIGKQGPVVTPVQQNEMDKFLQIRQNDGTQYDYCSVDCLMGGAMRIKPVYRQDKIQEATGADLAALKRTAEVAPSGKIVL